METTPALDAELAKDGVTFFICGRIDLPDYTLRLLDGSGEVTWGEGTFRGRDDLFGVLGGMDAITDGVGDQAPQLSVSFLPPSEAAAAELVAPEMQGSRIRVWIGALDGTTKEVVDEPYLLFDGELDQPTIIGDRGLREVEYDCVSAFELLFEVDEGNRLSDAHHQEVWPGETGLSAVTGVVKQVIWGPGDKIAGGFSGSGGVGGGGGGGFVDVVSAQVSRE